MSTSAELVKIECELKMALDSALRIFFADDIDRLAFSLQQMIYKPGVEPSTNNFNPTVSFLASIRIMTLFHALNVHSSIMAHQSRTKGGE